MCTLQNQIKLSWLRISHTKVFSSELGTFGLETHNPELGTLEWDILNPDRLINSWRLITRAELGTLEWINFNPDFLIRISTMKTFHFCPNPLFFSLLGYPLIVFSNENISVLSLVARFSLIGCYSFSDD